MQDLPCHKHEKTTQEKPGEDQKDVAGDLSRSCWQKPGEASNKFVILGSPITETSADSHLNGLQQNGKGDSAAATKLGFPDTKFDHPSDASQDFAGRRPLEAKREDVGKAQNIENTKNNGRENPHPDTWKYDENGNLLQAGERLKAEYDVMGNLKKVQIDDTTYERQGRDVVETAKGNDGKMHSYVNKDVDSFTLKTSDDNFKGASKLLDIKVSGKNGVWSHGTSLWDSPEKQASDRKYLKDQHQRSLDVANSTPEHPHPDTWTLDRNGNVTEAGNKFKAEYDPKTGELMSAKLGDDEWKRGPDNTVVHTYKRANGTTSSEVLDDVRSFTAKPYTDTDNGLLAGMTVEVGTGKTSSSALSKPIYENEEHAKWSGSIVNGWLGKDKGK